MVLMREINKLSPRVKQNMYKALEILSDISIKSVDQMRKVYPSVMKIGTKPIEEWKQPHTIILHPLAYFVTFWFPVKDQWDSIENGDRIVYVGSKFLLIKTNKYTGLVPYHLSLLYISRLAN